MRIQSSVTGMESERSFYAVRSSAGSFLDSYFAKYEDRYGETGGDRKTKEEGKTEENVKTVRMSVNDIMADMRTGKWRIGGDAMSADDGVQLRVRRLSLSHIFSILFREFIRSHHELFTTGTPETGSGGLADEVPGSGNRSMAVDREYYGEREEIGYKARGKAVCRDGREIGFDINIGMSREFERLAVKKLGFDPGRAIDPLVINLDSDVVSLSDQHFFFDLDGDGEAEKLRSLSGRCGYIALDKNGDGKIGDGTELFGTATGNGFEELAAYDEDGDGWIDEDDGIFDSLRVWIRENDGSERLISFKEAGIGAVNLMNSPTEFSLKNKQGKTDAVIRATGMFLYEDGRVGTLQQVDAVV